MTDNYNNRQFQFQNFVRSSVYNTGVIGFVNNQKTREMMHFWKESMKDQDDSKMCPGSGDQHYFNKDVVRSVFYSRLTVSIIDNTRWNLRCYALGQALKQFPKEHLAIIHGKPWEARQFWGVDLYDLVCKNLSTR